jgi:FMN phosphatase YigB (HAD superfamily)
MAGVKAEQSLMVGNDYFFDMAASKLGIKTWMTDNYRGHPEYKDKFRIDYQGSLEQLLEHL